MSQFPPVTPSDIRRLTPGLDAWYNAARFSDAQYDDTRIQQTIWRRIRQWEMTAQYRLMPAQVYPRAQDDGAYTGQNLPDGFVPLPDEAHPWYQGMVENFCRTRLHYRPVIKVDRLRMILGTEQNVFQPPIEWIMCDKDGSFNLVPLNTTAGITAFYSQFALFQMSFGGLGYVPDFLNFDYKVGLPPTNTIGQGTVTSVGTNVFGVGTYFTLGLQEYDSLQSGQDPTNYTIASVIDDETIVLASAPVPAWSAQSYSYSQPWWHQYEYLHLKSGVEKYCAIDVLERLAESINAGKDSKSTNVDGAGQQLNYSRFQRRLEQLQMESEKFMGDWMAQNTPILLEMF